MISSNFIFNILNKKLYNFNYKCNTRFAPEASGYLHIGHIKNIIINYDLSKIYNGVFKIRIDDTNPKKNKNKFIKCIKKNIKWILKKITNKKKQKIHYTSNYFHKLYQYIEYYKKKNIKKIKKIRKTKSGNFKEKKIIIINKKKYIFLLYRIKFIKHVKTFYNWFIYPFYNWGNTLSDKIENIQYSICSIEFSKNKKIYNFISNIIYKKKKVTQLEHSRLIIKDNITKKRIIYFLLKKKYIKKNDNRLLTINSLKNQGIKQNIIYSFLKELNTSRKFSTLNNKTLKKKIVSFIDFKYISIIKGYIKIYILNFKINKKFIINKKNIFSNEILIEKNNFIEEKNIIIFFLKNFKKKISLLNLKNIVCKNYKKNKQGYITDIICKFIKKKYIINYKNKWINYKYKIKFYIYNENNLINKKLKLNPKTYKKNIFYSENIIINYINNFYKCNKEYFFKNYFYKNKNNKIIFFYLK